MNTLTWLFTKIVWLLILAISLLGALLMLGTAAILHSTDSLPMGLAFLGGVFITLVPLLEWSAHKHARAAADPAATLVLRYSNFSLILTSFAFLAFAAACGLPIALGMVGPSGRWWAWLGLVIFAGTAVGVPIQRRLFALTLSPDGLDFSAFKTGPIPWMDIEGVTVSRMLRTKFVVLRLRDEQKYLAKSKRVRKWLRWKIQDSMFDVSPEWLMKAIQIRLDRYGMSDRPWTQTVQRQGSSA